MPVATKLRPAPQPRAILKPAGNRVTVSEEPKPKKENNVKTPQRPPQIPNTVLQSNVSLNSMCSSDSCSSTTKNATVAGRRNVKRNGFKPVRVVPDAVDVATVLPPLKRCEWITPNSGKRASDSENLHFFFSYVKC